MIKKLLNNRFSLYSVLLHVALGVFSASSTSVLFAFFFGVLAIEIPTILTGQKGLNVRLNYLLVYMSSFEILARMARTSPIIPYEMSKYILCALFLYGIFSQYNKGYIGLILLAFILPAAFYDQTGSVTTDERIFNIMGPVDLALGVIYFKGQIINRTQLFNLIKLALLPTISVLAFAFVRTPDYDSIDFNLSANFDTSGGFGSNQVSTILGLGLLLSFMLWITKSSLSGNKILDIIVMMGFVLQGLLTFSRGGMIGGALGILTFLFLISLSGVTQNTKNSISLPKITIYLIPILVLGLFVFQFVDSITGNNLSLRYKGETAGTIAGSKELDINTFTTNRYQIFLGDVELWRENFVLGVGVGASKELRPTTEEVPTAAHVELSRLLAEHGLFGLFFFLTLLVFPFLIISQNKDSLNKAILIAFFIIGLYSSFHAAMRTYVTPLFISMSLLTIRETPHKKKTKPYLDSAPLLDSQ